MQRKYVIAGPVKIGNLFGSYGHTLAKGEFAIVEDGEYINGGYGPSQSFHRVFKTRDEAEASLTKLYSDK